MKCPNCKEEILEKYTYCPSCGYNIKKLLNDKDLSFYHALELIKEKDYSEAISFLKISSRLGNDKAMYEYGKLYIFGYGVAPNNDYVIYCMSKAAKLGNEEAIVFLIDSYIFGKYGLIADTDMAKELFLTLSDNAKQHYSSLKEMLKIDDNEPNADATKTLGEIIAIKGELNLIDFDAIAIPAITKNNPVSEEETNLSLFYKQMDELIEKYKSGFRMENEFFFDDVDQWENEIYIRNSNNKTVQDLDYIKTILPSPYIGRMDILFNNEENVDKVYVGREPVWDANNNLLVSSWYSPIGNKIYDDVHTSWSINGKKVKLKLKRNISINNQKLIDVYETFNDDNNLSDNKNISDAYLLKILEKKHLEGHISDIVSSIQYYQNQIITSPFSKSLIMQGCAGCGKTMVLFHRLKYMIGNNLRNSNSICIITPNEKFNNYITPLIYDLKLKNINMYSIINYYIAILDSFQSEKVSIRFSSMFHKNNTVLNPIRIDDDDTLPESIVNYYYSNEFFEKVSSLKQIKINPLSTIKLQKDNIYDFCEVDLLNTLLGSEEKTILPQYKHNKGSIHKCELYALCLFYYMRCGEYRYQSKEYKLTETSRIQYNNFKFNMFFIDEAQDLSLSEYRFINSFNGNKICFNLFGDTDQTITSYGINHWNELSDYLGNFNYFSFNKNYRNTSEIIEYVNKKLKKDMENIGYNSYAVLEIPTYKLPLYFTNDNYNRKIILCSVREKTQLKLQYPLLADSIFSIKEIKGMEYDSVYVLTKEMMPNEIYIAMTRALERLVVLY